MCQSRPLFVYLRPSIIQIEKSVDDVLGVQTRVSRMVGRDETMAIWRPPNAMQRSRQHWVCSYLVAAKVGYCHLTIKLFQRQEFESGSKTLMQTKFKKDLRLKQNIFSAGFESVRTTRNVEAMICHRRKGSLSSFGILLYRLWHFYAIGQINWIKI